MFPFCLLDDQQASSLSYGDDGSLCLLFNFVLWVVTLCDCNILRFVNEHSYLIFYFGLKTRWRLIYARLVNHKCLLISTQFFLRLPFLLPLNFSTYCHRYIVFTVSSKEVKYQLEAGLSILYPKHYINNMKVQIVCAGGRIHFMRNVQIYQREKFILKYETWKIVVVWLLMFIARGM